MHTPRLLRAVQDFVRHPSRPQGQLHELMTEAVDPRLESRRWTPQTRPEDVRNAHNTNTVSEMKGALEGPYNCLEADVRLEGDVRPLPGYRHRDVIAAHDDLSTNGFRLQEWLPIAIASGRGIKLDIKADSAVPEIIRQCRAFNVPQERLILNGGVPLRAKNPFMRLALFALDKTLQRETTLSSLKSMRDAFPGAMIAITPSRQPESEADYQQMQKYASTVGGRVMFPIRAEYVTPMLVSKLKPYGQIAIWNDPGTFKPVDVAATTAQFRAMGVDGIIDLRNEVELK